jgi:diguanylate cyclase (GGDEF)-like protein
MELAYVAEVHDDEFRFRALDGDAASFGGLAAGTRIPRRDTLCDRMLSGALANVVPDVAAAAGAQGTTGSPGVGSYVGVPVQLGDGTIYGSLCCVSTRPSPALLDRDARVLEVLARIIADQIDRERQQRRSARLEGEATAGQALLAALKARERYTAQHSEAVVELATAVAEQLGLPDDEAAAVADPAQDTTAQPESELRALIAVAGAVSAAHRLEDVLEVVGEETRRVVGASSVSISRWEREHDRVRTLINVGELGPGEDRFPTSETYELAEYPLAAQLLREGASYVISRGDRDLGPHDRRLLEALDKSSYIGVPVIFDGRTWGKLEAFANISAAPFTRRHIPFLEAIAGQVGAAIGRAELFSHVNALAYSDPLTGLGNRRALDERLEAAVDRGGPLAIAFCDLDGLKQVNDTLGHDAGDRAIRRAADALAAAAAGCAGAYVCRVGGDEFCIVLEGRGIEAAFALAAEAGRVLAADDAPLTLSCGVADMRPGARPADLFRAADAAQYAAKREGGGRVVVAEADAADRPPASGRRSARNRTAGETRELAERLLDEIAAAPEGERLERLSQALRDA